ncbi:hypothetical protein FEM41_18240 [Jejubacter calystegiae]|uniref:Transferase n=1 Tax=Jejubacter calystegiae TaxID=2579935 RepID=A0A4P8YKY4_9ENTR|nr:YdcK family protein [Jejubacter calystegiae]QCT21451.1 hypothetical protein FEM41_18240 [Jejubacter calystegiae]
MQKFRLLEQKRPFTIMQGDVRCTLWLRQLEAITDFADVRAGQRGGWLEEEELLSQSGDCWVYSQNSILYGGAWVTHNARITGECVIGQGAIIDGNALVDSSQVTHHAHIGDQVAVRASQVSGQCQIGDVARVSDSQVIARRGLTAEKHQQLRIADRASVHASRIMHQAQIIDSALVSYAFIEHRACVSGHAVIEGNEENDVWLCDQAWVGERARILAGRGEGQSPTLRYSSRVGGNAQIVGECLLKHRVRVEGDAVLTGGPLQLDDRVSIDGHARVTGNVLIEHRVRLTDEVSVEAWDDETIHIHGDKTLAGSQHITRMPYYGVPG